MDEQKLRENLDVMDSLIAELRQDDSKGITDVQRAYSELLQLLAEGESQVMHLIQGEFYCCTFGTRREPLLSSSIQPVHGTWG